MNELILFFFIFLFIFLLPEEELGRAAKLYEPPTPDELYIHTNKYHQILKSQLFYKKFS